MQRSGPPSPASLGLSLRCDLAEVQPAAQSFHEFLAQHGVPEKSLSECQLAFIEACNNAIENTPSTPAPSQIAVQVQFEPQAIEIRVIDHTTGFDFPEHPTLPPSQSERGRGLYLIRSVMDSVVYTHAPTGNELLMRKRL